MSVFRPVERGGKNRDSVREPGLIGNYLWDVLICLISQNKWFRFFAFWSFPKSRMNWILSYGFRTYHWTKKRISPSSSWLAPMIRLHVQLLSNPSSSCKKYYVSVTSHIFYLCGWFFIFRMIKRRLRFISFFKFSNHSETLKIFSRFPSIFKLSVTFPFD